MAKRWKEAATLILASRINFMGNKSACTSSTRSQEGDSQRVPFEDNRDFRFLLLRRNARSSFMPGGYVFPGGMTSSSDVSDGWRALFDNWGVKLDSFQNDSSYLPPIFEISDDCKIPKAVSLRITAIRETFEECGVLLCRNKLTQDVSNWASYLSGADILKWQKRVHEEPAELLNLCKSLECIPDIWALHLWSNWLTPINSPKRFDSVFFIALLDQRPPTFIDNLEVDDLQWCSPSDIQQKSHMPPPQFYEISRLNNFKTSQHLLDFAVQRAKLGCERWLAVQVKASDGVVFFLPGDDLYPTSPEVFEHAPMAKLTETLAELRQKCTKLHRIESNGKNVERVYASNVGVGYGHLLPVADG